jgi:hypothetical protein
MGERHFHVMDRDFKAPIATRWTAQDAAEHRRAYAPQGYIEECYLECPVDSDAEKGDRTT